MFNSSKYTKIYHQIVNRARSRILTGYIEKHHIIPRALGGNDSMDNLVNLTAREHFICHWLLTKMTSGPEKNKMFWALNGMSMKNPFQQRHETKITSKVYSNTKKIIADECRGKPGTKHSEESKEKIRNARAKQDMTNRLGKPRSDETKQKIKIARAKQDMSHLVGKQLSSETKKKIGLSKFGNQYASGSKRSVEVRLKMSASIRDQGGYGGEKNPMFGKSQSAEAKLKISQARKENPLTPEQHKKLAAGRVGSVWWNDTISETRSKLQPRDNWFRGRLTTPKENQN